MLVGLGLVAARLVELTAMLGADYRRRADENRIYIRPIRAARGVILDRSGQALVRNVPIKRKLDLPGDEFGEIEIEDVGRAYPLGTAFAHVIGYVGEVSPEEIEKCESAELSETDCGLSPGDVIGKSGLEKQYDAILRGTDGAQLVEVDANGKLLKVVGEQPATSGKNLDTSLDAPLQQAMLGAVAGRRGAAVAIDPANGSILGLVSSPSFDPNVFIGVGSENSEISELLSDTVNLPLFNRAIGGEYPPGSIFKLITAVAGLSDRKVTAATTVEDTGEIKIGDFRFGNWYFDQYGRREGIIGLTRALSRSNDIFFYKVGEWVGADRLADWARRFGLGQKSGLDLPGETSGLVPDPGWKERQIGERWYLGNTYHMAIGQGDVRLTPLQAAMMAATAVTGKRCQPHIQRTENRKQKSAASPAPRQPAVIDLPDASEPGVCEEIGLSDENRQLILEGMIGACSPGGTAFPFFEWNAPQGSTFPDGKVEPLYPMVACKTGTAQHGAEATKPHAWILVAGPVGRAEGQRMKDEGQTQTSQQNELDLSDPKRIVLAVMLEEAGEGSYEAGPVAREILTKWFQAGE